MFIYIDSCENALCTKMKRYTNSHNERMYGKVGELADIAKLTDLIKEKKVSSFVSIVFKSEKK